MAAAGLWAPPPLFPPPWWQPLPGEVWVPKLKMEQVRRQKERSPGVAPGGARSAWGLGAAVVPHETAGVLLGEAA